jgi:hypothetical protein
MRKRRLKSGIYCIKNIITNKVYIGSSVNIKNRIKGHERLLKRDGHYNNYLQKAWSKYKEESFMFTVLERVINEQLIEREQYWIDFYQSAKRKFGYNICPKAGNTLGVRPSKETLIKLSKAQSGKNNGMYGKTHTEEVRRRLSRFHTGLKMPEGFKETMSKVTKGENNGMYGKTHTEEAKTIIYQKLKQRGGYKGERNPNFGRKWPEEKRKMASLRTSDGRMVGDNNPNVKIKSHQYPEIIKRIDTNGPEEISFLAKQYGVCTATINNILKKVGYEINKY